MPRRSFLLHFTARTALLILTACASSSPATGGRTTRLAEPTLDIDVYHEAHGQRHVVPASVQRVWVALGLVYARLGIPVTVSSVAQRQLGNQGVRTRSIDKKPLSLFLDCGSGLGVSAYADSYDVTLAVLTTLQPKGPDSTVATTVVTASAKARDVSAYPVQCASKGTLEKEIAEFLTGSIVAGPPHR